MGIMQTAGMAPIFLCHYFELANDAVKLYFSGHARMPSVRQKRKIENQKKWRDISKFSRIFY